MRTEIILKTISQCITETFHWNPWSLSHAHIEACQRESTAVCKHTNSAVTSYPREFSFKKGRRKSISSLFSSLIIGSRRTYSSKEKPVLHFKVRSFACFLSPRKKNHQLLQSACCPQDCGLKTPTRRSRVDTGSYGQQQADWSRLTTQFCPLCHN